MRTQPHETHAASRPRKGQQITYRGKPYGTVASVEGGLCFVRREGEHEALPFIWCFHDGLNTLHDWPTKAGKVEEAA
jgi:hypothetical protein